MNAQQLQSVTVEATVIRRDGTVEPLGEIAAWHRNPIRRAINKVLGKGTVNVQKEQP